MFLSPRILPHVGDYVLRATGTKTKKGKVVKMGGTSSFLPFNTGISVLNKSHTMKRFDKGGKDPCTVKEPMALSAFPIIIREICWFFSLIARISLVNLLPKLVNKLFSLH